MLGIQKANGLVKTNCRGTHANLVRSSRFPTHAFLRFRRPPARRFRFPTSSASCARRGSIQHDKQTLTRDSPYARPNPQLDCLSRVGATTTTTASVRKSLKITIPRSRAYSYHWKSRVSSTTSTHGPSSCPPNLATAPAAPTSALNSPHCVYQKRR